MDQSEYTLYSLQRFQTRSYVFNLVSVTFIRRISNHHNMLLIQYHKIILFFKRSTTSVAPTRETTRQDMLGSNANLNHWNGRTFLRMGSNRFVPVSATVFDGTRIYDAWWQQHRSRGLSRAFSPPPLPCRGAVGRRRVRWFRFSRFPRVSLCLYYITRSQCTPPKRSSPLRSDRR